MQATTLSFLFSAALIVAGCDSSSVYERCVDSDDPGAAPGTRRLSCPSSSFNEEDPRAREVGGVVRRGDDFVPGALVRIDPWFGFADASSASTASTITDSVGAFGGLRPVSLRYDLSIKLGEDLLYYRALAARYIEPSFEGPRTFARAFRSRVEVQLDRAARTDHALAFFASGDGVFAVSDEPPIGLSVGHRRYTNPVRIHVLEYETPGGFEKASAYGVADVVLDAGTVRLVTIALGDIKEFVEPKFLVSAPHDFAPSMIDIKFRFARTSDAPLVSVPVGASKRIPVIPDAEYTYRSSATRDGAVSDTGEIVFNALLPMIEIGLPDPPNAASPLDGEERGMGEALLVDGEGVFEHVLVPKAGGRAIHIISRQREVTVPDVTRLGASPALGPHIWTVRSFSTARFPEDLLGLDPRGGRPMGVSRPRSIVLR